MMLFAPRKRHVIGPGRNNSNNIATGGFASSPHTNSFNNQNYNKNMISFMLLLLGTSIASFMIGNAWHMNNDNDNNNDTIHCSSEDIMKLQNENQQLNEKIHQYELDIQSTIEIAVQKRIHDDIDIICSKQIRHLENDLEHQHAADNAKHIFPTETVGRYVVGMSRTSKQDFTDLIDMGVPLDIPNAGSEELLLLYSHVKALPTSLQHDSAQKGDTYDTTDISTIDMPSAIEHCDYLNVILTDHSSNRKQCVAILPQYESYHIQKWMRINPDTGALDSNQPLTMVSRGQQSNGRDQFAPPDLEHHTRKHWNMLRQYFDNVDLVLNELKPILSNIAIDNTVIVMVCNYGQSQLLINFVCAAKSRNFPISNIIVFTTDQETTDIVSSLGLTAYYDKRNFGDIPSGAARRYGDARFTAMMMAKVICVQLVSMLGYDFLFQDVDIVWFRNPMEYFHQSNNPKIANYDVFFQDDGGHSVRYAPYSANSGFYYIRYNDRTRHFLTSLLMAGDLILKTDSHQQALIALLNEHVSLYGLKAKVLARHEEEFPGGYQFHQRSKEYMTKFFNGTYKPYIFHMSWTLNKDNKLLFFRQMNEWYVNEPCVDHKVNDVLQLSSNDNDMNTTAIGEMGTYSKTCCSVTPIFSCHYRDKPSYKPCKDSPPIDKGRPSWW